MRSSSGFCDRVGQSVTRGWIVLQFAQRGTENLSKLIYQRVFVNEYKGLGRR